MFEESPYVYRIFYIIYFIILAIILRALFYIIKDHIGIIRFNNMNKVKLYLCLLALEQAIRANTPWSFYTIVLCSKTWDSLFGE